MARRRGYGNPNRVPVARMTRRRKPKRRKKIGAAIRASVRRARHKNRALIARRNKYATKTEKHRKAKVKRRHETKKIKKGTLHRMMGIPAHKKIPTSELRRSIRVAKFWLKYPGNGGGRTRAGWKKLRARAQMALNFRKKKRK